MKYGHDCVCLKSQHVAGKIKSIECKGSLSYVLRHCL